jgi:hypothetical protein
MYLTVGNAINPATGNVHPVPQEYLEFTMCEFYRCLPSQLRQEDWATINLHLKFLDLRATAQAMRDGTTSAAAGGSNTLAPPPPPLDAAATLEADQAAEP